MSPLLLLLAGTADGAGTLLQSILTHQLPPKIQLRKSGKSAIAQLPPPGCSVCSKPQIPPQGSVSGSKHPTCRTKFTLFTQPVPSCTGLLGQFALGSLTQASSNERCMECAATARCVPTAHRAPTAAPNTAAKELICASCAAPQSQGVLPGTDGCRFFIFIARY